MKKLLTAVLFVALFVCAGPDVYGQCPLTPPVLQDPTGPTANFGTVTLRWDAVLNAATYEVFISVDNGPIQSHGHQTGTTKTLIIEPGRFIQWKVTAHKPSCASTSSAIASFTTTCPTDKPETVTPLRNAHIAEGATVNFTWQGIAGAASYDLIVTPDNGQTFTTLAENLTNRAFSTTLANGAWGWHVRANFDGSCAPMFSEPSSFQVGPVTCDNPVPQLISPANGATSSLPITFSWTAVDGATGYNVVAVIGNELRVVAHTTSTSAVLQQGIDGTFLWFVQATFADSCSTVSERRTITIQGSTGCSEAGPALVSPANGATNAASPVTFDWNELRNANRYALFVSVSGDDFRFYGFTQETALEAFVPDGVIRWFVVAMFAGCPDTRSATFTFTAGRANTCPTGTITLQAPAQNSTVSAPVTFFWSPVNGIEAYRVTVLVNGTTPVSRRTTSTQETFDLPAGPMKWYVEGLREGCDPILSTQGLFTVARATNCANNQPPALIAPSGTVANPTQVTSPVAFSWNPSAGAIAYRLWISRNGNAFEDIGFTDKTQLSLPLQGGLYAWRIDAIFRGCDPVRSTTAFFRIADTEVRCPNGAPVPLAPAQGSTVAAPIQFRWAGVLGADRYRVFLSLDGSEERLIGTTPETELERVIPPGMARWRVEAVSDRCASTTSPVIQFTIPQAANCTGTAAGLVSPANGSTTNDQEIDFVWTPVAGVVRYVIMAKTEDGSAIPIGDTADSQFTRRMPYGRVEWWVVTFFAGCRPTESEHFRFVITPPQNCPNRRPILLLPSESSVFSPVTFAWSRVPNATAYQVWVAEGADSFSVIATATENTAEAALAPGTYRWYVEATFANACPSTESAVGEFTVNEPEECGTPRQPKAHVIAQALSNTPYRVRWTPLPNVDLYEVQESTSPTFDNAATIIADEPSLRFVHENSGAPVQYLYRVRGISRCDDSRGPYSDPAGVFIVAPRTNSSSAEVGVEGTIVQTVVLPASATPLPFVAKVDKPWLTVTPSSGTVGAAPVTLTVTADPGVLVLGTNTGTVTVTYTAPSLSSTWDSLSGCPAGKDSLRGCPTFPITTNATTVVTTPISVSLVTPVTPTGKGTPPPDALIFPIVGHAVGVNDSLFESDIRIANLTPQTMKYQVNFTPSGTDGTQTGSSTTIEVPPNTTTALDDIVASVFGTGTTSSATGMLEVRPLTTTATTSPSLFSTVSSTFPSLATAASSRTYNFTPNGTFGQFIPAVPFSKFVGRGTILSLLQVSQSAAYRANFGFAEAAGSPVDLMVRVYDTKNALLASIPVSLGATQHTQINGMLAANGIDNLTDGRVEVEVVNGNGKVTAYVSEIDNKTNDPLLVNAVPKTSTATNRWVVPGMAYINNGFAFWVSDLRIFNAGTTSTPATLTFYTQGNVRAPVTRQITLDAGEIEVLDNVVSTLFGLPDGTGGAIAITTPVSASLHATARTYNQTSNGTYGQFIPAVTVAESIGNGDRALQLLQLESSSRFRTNIGLNETSGNPVTVEIFAIQPDSIVTPVATYDLGPGEFRQISLADFFEPGAAVYNARVTVKVIAGSGKVTAYGSAIDVITQDPTYVPAQ